MFLFWEQGYEPTSVQQLRDRMGGISAASFYAAFGSKEGLFEAAVARYLETHGLATAALRDETLPPRLAIEMTLRCSVRMQTAPGHPSGCLIVLGASNCSPENRHIEALLIAERTRNRLAIQRHLERAVITGALPLTADLSVLASVFSAFLHGISCEARDGATREDLDASITGLMKIWDTVAGAAPSGYAAARN